MWQDPIVEEVRKVREGHAARYNFDLRRIYQELKKAEQQSASRKVTFAPKRIKPIKTESNPALSV